MESRERATRSSDYPPSQKLNGASPGERVSSGEENTVRGLNKTNAAS